ncbi:MAG: gliding motility-associated C-terminal domain-containing protein [bacterium]
MNKKEHKHNLIMKITKLLIITALLGYTNILPIMSLVKNAEAAGLSSSTPKIYVTNLEIGNTYRLSTQTNGIFIKVTNTDPITTDLGVHILGDYWASEASEGYDPLPDAQTSWITPDPDSFTAVGYNETVDVDLEITIPDDPQYAGKQYYCGVWVVQENFAGFAGAGVIAKLYFNIISGGPSQDAPTNVNVVDATTGGKLNLSWVNPASLDHIHVYRSTTAGSTGTLVHDNITGETLSDTGLTNGTTYYYVVRAMNSSGTESTNNDQYSGVPTGTGDAAPPEIAGTPSVENKILLPNKQFRVDALISDNVQVTSATVYYRKAGDTSYSNASFSPAPDGSSSYSGSAYIPSDIVTTAGFEYYLEASDGLNSGYVGSSSNPEEVLNVGKATIAVYGISNDLTVVNSETWETVASMSIPANALSRQTEIRVTQLDPVSLYTNNSDLTKSDTPVLAYELEPHGTQFNKPINITMYYNDIDSDGVVDATNVAEDGLAMFFYDGQTWRYIRSSVDVANNKVTATVDHFTTFALFPARLLAASDYRPARKIITPNGDGTNDEALFTGLTSEIKIFDVTGKLIRTVSASTGKWDGKDDDGDVARNGVYIYQYKYDGTLISGTIAVAK